MLTDDPLHRRVLKGVLDRNQSSFLQQRSFQYCMCIEKRDHSWTIQRWASKAERRLMRQGEKRYETRRGVQRRQESLQASALFAKVALRMPTNRTFRIGKRIQVCAGALRLTAKPSIRWWSRCRQRLGRRRQSSRRRLSGNGGHFRRPVSSFQTNAFQDERWRTKGLKTAVVCCECAIATSFDSYGHIADETSSSLA